MKLSECLYEVFRKMNKYTVLLGSFPHITRNSTDNKKYRNIAYKWVGKLERRKKKKTFDLGFLFYSSFVLGYRITDDPYLRDVALEVANTLTTLFNKNLVLFAMKF